MKPVGVELVVMTVLGGALEALLVRRSGNQWSLPAGMPEPGVRLQDAAAAVLARQTGITGITLEQLYTFDRDDAARVAVDYLALIAADRHPLLPGSEVVQVRWFPLDDLPPLPDEHAEALEYGHRRLRAKTAYAPIAVQVLPDAFTLGELQAVYEAVLGARLDTRNFRRDVLGAGVVEEVGIERRSGPGRPARLYRSVPGEEFAVVARERRIEGAPSRPAGAGVTTWPARAVWEACSIGPPWYRPARTRCVRKGPAWRPRITTRTNVSRSPGPSGPLEPSWSSPRSGSAWDGASATSGPRSGSRGTCRSSGSGCS